AERAAGVVDSRVLRRLDRVDTIVIDADVLTTGAMVVGDVVPVGKADAAMVTGAVYALFAADRLDAIRSDGTFKLGPLDALGLSGRAGARTAARLTAGGASCLLGLAEGRRLRAVIGVREEQAGGAVVVLEAARRADATFMLAGHSSSSGTGSANSAAGEAASRRRGLAGRVGLAHGAARVLRDRRRLVASVRGLQAEGAS